MASLPKSIKVKEKDYEYLEKVRRVKLVPATYDPLINKKKAEANINSSALRGLKSEAIKISDPLTKKNILKDPLSVLKGESKELPKKDQKVEKENENEKNFEIKKTTQDNNTAIKEKTMEFKSIENKKETGVWKIIRNEFVQIFDLRNIEHFVHNPFGNLAIQDDRPIKQTRHGENRLDFEDYSLKKQTFAAISEKLYLKNVENMHREMKHFWEIQDKVSSLQITIQSCKLLVENDFPKFYPVKYVYVIDIVEQFGIFVFERMKSLSFVNLGEEKIFQMNDNAIIGKSIPESAQEICKNWLLKIGSIRELIPRMYVEATLLKLYFFLDGSKIKPLLMRLAMMSRSIADPMISSYFSTFLLKIAAEILPKEKSHILLILDDFFNMMKNPEKFGNAQLSPEEYFRNFHPFLKTIFSFYSENCSQQEFKDLLIIYSRSNRNPEILKKIIANSNPVNICHGSIDIFNFIKQFPLKIRNEIYPDFLHKLSKCIPNQTICETLCNGMWKDISQSTIFSDFLNMVANLIDLIYKSFKGYQKNQFFHQMLDKFNDFFITLDNSGNKNMDVFQKLEDFLQKILLNCDDISEILSLEPFLQFIQYFPDSIKPQVCTSILNIFVEKDTSEKIKDPISVHSVLSIAKNLNPDYSANLGAEERKSINNLINKFMMKIDFGRDLEQSLNLHAEVRSHFGNIPEIIENLIYKTIDLTFKAKFLSKGKLNKKIVGFIQACIAYCYISIPSIEDFNVQLKLYLFVAQVALSHNMISQSENLFKAAVVLISELPEYFEGKPIDMIVQSYIKNLLSFLVVLPENPENDYLHISTGFKEAMDRFKWNKKTGVLNKIAFLIDFVAFLCIQLQPKLPYHVENVKSNDSLFVENEFKLEVVEKINQTLKEVTSVQSELDFQTTDSNILADNCKTCIYCINVLIQYFEPNEIISKIIRNFFLIIRKRLNDIRQEKSMKITMEKMAKSIHYTFENMAKNYNDVDLIIYKEEIKPYLNIR